MNIYHVKMLIFTFLINILVSPHNENYLNNDYNVSFIQNNTKRTTIKSRLLAQTQIHNPHYHNDPELKEIIDKMNEEAIKKYQQTHDPYEQLKEVVEKNGTKIRGGHAAEPMSTIEKELLETYEEFFGDESRMLKSGKYPNDDDGSDKSSTCECTDINKTKLAKTKGRDKYLKHLKWRCTRAICFCSVGSLFLTLIGTAAARGTIVTALGETYSKCASAITLLNMLDANAIVTALKASGTACANVASKDIVTHTVMTSATAIFEGCGIAALVLLVLAVILIILYIWLYRKRKNSWKHECKKHLCR
ncbi:hypothetical protein PFMC_05895 [Plasmodium falciparum CAMP/Malaysia]|uniref:Stevor n=1 Tax=Plasmodium falciparum (isolate Camp / Malaysia) TaxID=5835 RepID=A0A024WZT8_PLAFC|nr:hypothetical protein PFMC_05895 [Plasmodium falciparum CAMP/Malaysia]